MRCKARVPKSLSQGQVEAQSLGWLLRQLPYIIDLSKQLLHIGRRLEGHYDRVFYYQEGPERHYPNLCGRRLVYRLGNRVRYVISNGEVRILAVRPISRLFGMLQRNGPAVTLEEMEQAIAYGACKG